MKKLTGVGALLVLLFVWSCAGYEYKPVPFRAAESYPNHVTVAGAVIAARAWADNAEASKAFGFDIRGAGLTPVQIVVDNKSNQALKLIPDQTLLRDTQDNMWNILPAQVAYERIDKQVRVSRMGGEGGKQAALGGVAGAVIGAAFGIITGSDIAETAGKGAVAGAAIGAVKGGVEGYSDPRSRSNIRSDLESKSLKDKPFSPMQLTHGFLFFPGEVVAPTVLRLKLHEMTTGEDHLIELSVSAPTAE